MCGITGIVHFDRTRVVDPSTLERMSRTLVHRGPDDEGTFVGDSVGLAIRRLSIVDVQGGHQPMSNEDGSIWVVLNGEIYNHLDHRQWLVGRGHQFRTKSDTEVLLHLYEECGLDLPAKLNGMFAFALWDRRRQRLLLARDHLGVKQLYFCHGSDSLVFASEIKALLEFPGIPRKLFVEGASDYFNFGTPWGANTFFEGIRLLEPGHSLVIENGNVTKHAFWNVKFNPDYRQRISSEEVALAELEALLVDAVKRQLMSDVPVGCFLSGGIDSSLLTAIASQHYEKEFQVFTAVSDAGALYDESPYAGAVAREFGAKHYTVRLGPEGFPEALPRLIWHLDEPRIGASIFPQFHISRLAREHVKVCLGGQGGDELFGGYARYFLLEPWKNALRLLTRKIRGSHGPSPVGANVQKQFDLPVARWFLTHLPTLFHSYDRRYFEQYSWVSPHVRHEVFSGDFRKSLDQTDGLEKVRQVLRQTDFPDPLARTNYLEIKTYLNGLLITEDRMSMANSLESRVPLLDYRLVELALHLPSDLKLRGLTSKYALKRICSKWLPESVLNRRKLGYPVPIDAWFESSLNSWCKEVLLDGRTTQRGYYNKGGIERLLSGRVGKNDRNWGRVIWGLVNFELWNRIFIDAEGCGLREGFNSLAASEALACTHARSKL